MNHRSETDATIGRFRLRWLLILACLFASGPALPALADADYDQGRALFGQRRYVEAAESFQRCMDKNPSDTRALLELGRSRSAAQQWDEAISSYERLIELQPSNEKAWNNLGNVYFRTGRYVEAGGYYEKALERKPEYQTARFHYGYTLHQLNRPAEAATQFDRCLRIQPATQREARTRIDCGFYRGVLFYREGRFSDAAGTMEQVIQAMPPHPEAHYYLGMAYRRLGRTDEARRELEQHKRIKEEARTEEPVRKAGSP